MKEEEDVSGKKPVPCVPLADIPCTFGQPPVSLCGAGLFSSAMRDLANISHKGPKWIILDGDIDPMWIESLNTVMDDNKVGAIAPQQSGSLLSSG